MEGSYLWRSFSERTLASKRKFLTIPSLGCTKPMKRMSGGPLAWMSTLTPKLVWLVVSCSYWSSLFVSQEFFHSFYSTLMNMFKLSLYLRDSNWKTALPFLWVPCLTTLGLVPEPRGPDVLQPRLDPSWETFRCQSLPSCRVLWNCGQVLLWSISEVFLYNIQESLLSFS